MALPRDSKSITSAISAIGSAKSKMAMQLKRISKMRLTINLNPTEQAASQARSTQVFFVPIDGLSQTVFEVNFWLVAYYITGA